MTEWYEMSEMTSPEFKAAMETVRMALVPVGATEQHGPNLALSTDYQVGHRLAQKIAARLHPRAIVAPPLPFGVSHHHMGFAGTITVSAETFITVGFEIARSLRAHGLNHVLFVNGHNGNTGPLNVLTTKIRYELDMRAATSFYFGQASDVIKANAKTDRFGHACEIETSVLMALAPDLVRTDALAPGEMIPQDREFAFNNQPHALQIPVPFDQQTRNGAFGDARLADVGIGTEIVDTAVERTVAFCEGFLAEG